jgi:F420-dependent oxidoreductase-like protein
MRLGVHLTRFDTAHGAVGIAPMLAELGRASDESGVAVLTLMDHHFQLPYLGVATDPMLEGYTSLGYLAAVTERVELGLLVTGVTYRHPGILAKTVTTLDVLSGGRAVLGIGAAWYEREHRGLGIPFPPLRDRFELLDETLAIVRQMWSAADGPFTGRHFTLAETICSPQPLRPPPVIVGGVGERKTLRLVARYADRCNIFAGGDQGAGFVAGKLAVLRDHCEAEGTSYDDLGKTVLWTPPVDPAAPAEFLDAMRAMADVGVDEVHVMPGPGSPADFVRGLGVQVVPALAGL